MSKPVLVLGGRGFLGTALCERLTETGAFTVYAADIAGSDHAGVRNLQVDILNYDSLSSALRGIDLIVNCTGQITNPINACLELNSSGILNICKALAGTGQSLIHISTTGVYGTRKGTTSESDRMNPETPYATCKSFAEIILSEGMDRDRLSILRLPNLYGELQTKGILGYLISSFNADKELKFNNNGHLNRYYLHDQDAANIICRFIEAGPFQGIFNVKGPDKISIRELVSLCNEISGKELRVLFDSRDPWENISELDDSLIQSKISVAYRFDIRSYLSGQLAK